MRHHFLICQPYITNGHRVLNSQIRADRYARDRATAHRLALRLRTGRAAKRRITLIAIVCRPLLDFSDPTLSYFGSC